MKLGPAIVDPKLDKEVTRIIKNEDALPDAMPGTGETDPIVIDFVDPDLPESGLTPLISPQPFEIPPYPVTLRTLDVSREVEKVRESRKRIKLGGLAYSNLPNPVTGELTDTGVGKPSVCLFTIHDVGESLICSRFSEDSTLMGAGFSESYIRLWNLKGGKLAGLRNDFDSDDITDGKLSLLFFNPL